MKVLLVDHPRRPLPETLERAARAAGWDVTRCPGEAAALDALPGCAAAVIAAAPASENAAAFHALVRRLEDLNIPTILLADRDAPSSWPRGGFLESAGPEFSPDEWRGRLAMIERYQTHLTRLERELANMARMGQQINSLFQESDQEMRLAARLQQAFLPRLHDPPSGPRFAALYRPASWVSGDFYDVLPLDPHHTAFYLIDAVGHGVAAGLLTVFLKQALTPRMDDMNGSLDELPAIMLARANRLLYQQQLPQCQFVTAWYGLLDHHSLRLRYARAGHPYPVFLSRDGSVRELQSEGGLLGIMEEESFDAREITLAPGDKLFLYSDGLECCLPTPGHLTPLHPPAAQLVRSLDHGSADALIRRMEQRIDHQAGSLNPQDDITVLALEIPGL